MKQYFAFQWHITDECDQRCKHCYIFSENNCKKLDSMSWAQMQDTFYNCLDFCQVYDRLPYFYITGGDPILHPDFWRLLALLKEHGIPFTILGNPFHLTDEVCRRLKEHGCQKYQLSLDGLRETHDWFRKPGSFDCTLDKIRCIKKAGIRSVIMTTVSGVNIREVPAIIDAVVQAGADVFAFARYCPTSEEKDTGMSCLRTRKHCPPTDDFGRFLRQSSLPATKDGCAAFPCTSSKIAGRRVQSSSGPGICAQSALERARGILGVFRGPLRGAMGQIPQPEPMFSCPEAAIAPLEYRALLDTCYQKFQAYEAAGCPTYFNKKDHLWTLYEYEKGIFQIPEDAQDGVIYGGCNCGNCHMTILPTGDIYACRRVQNSRVGNVFEDRIADVWVCQMEAYRDYTKFEKCSKCELMAYCRGCPAVASGKDGNFYAADPQCWKEVQ